MPITTPRLAVFLLGSGMLAACDRAPAPEAAPTPAVTPAPEAPPAPVPDPAQPPPEAPPPTEPSPAPKPTAADDPNLATMRLAQSDTQKLSVAAQLRYQFDGDTLHLAAVSRVPGQKLDISLKDTPGLQYAAGPVSVQKAGSGNAYRQQYSIIRGAGAPASLRVLVTMDSPAGSAFGFFTVPLDAAVQ